jgi:citrate synthase
MSKEAADRVDDYIRKLLGEKKKAKGFGHRVYRTEDPRATVSSRHWRNTRNRRN